MKALALTQPWASLVAVGAKRIETRSWGTRHRGPLLIYAAKRLPGGMAELEAMMMRREFYVALRDRMASTPETIAASLPRGKFVAVAELGEVWETDELLPALLAAGSNAEVLYGNYASGRFAWMLDDVRAIEPAGVPKRSVTCFQGLFDVPDGLAADMIAMTA